MRVVCVWVKVVLLYPEYPACRAFCHWDAGTEADILYSAAYSG